MTRTPGAGSLPAIDRLKREAKALRRAAEAGDGAARARFRAAGLETWRHADALHVTAREAGWPSWPELKLAAETRTLDRAERLRRLRVALVLGQGHVVRRLLADDPGLAAGDLAAEIALYDAGAVRARLARDPGAAARPLGPRAPIHHLAYSRYHEIAPERRADMLAVAGALLAAGADVNAPAEDPFGSGAMLSPLYAAIGHSRNLPLARRLLEAGADPNDGESLYHATELGHSEGVRLLLSHGAQVAGTNAIPRALDFDDRETIALLLAAGGDPNEGISWPDDLQEPPMVIPALPQAARRLCSRQTVRLLLESGADPSALWQGKTPYAMARVYGNAAAAEEIAAAGGDTALSGTETILARAADGAEQPGTWLDPAKLDPEWRGLIRAMLHLPGKLPHVRRLVALGLETDRPDAMGLTPVQIAGWEGLPEAMDFFLSLKPDLGHVNSYGGTLLSTIVHGAANCPARETRDHVACARRALEEGVALPRSEIDGAPEALAAFLGAWAERHPGAVIDDRRRHGG